MKNPLKLLSIDSLGGLAAGVATIALSPILTVWYGWPIGFVLFVGFVNIGYGCFSGFMALRMRRSNKLSKETVIILVIANSIWLGQCLTQAWWRLESSSYLGLAHLVFEGLYVGGLAYLEARLVLPTAT